VAQTVLDLKEPGFRAMLRAAGLSLLVGLAVSALITWRMHALGSFVWDILGFPGAFVWMLVTGAHGGSHDQELVGGILCFVLNSMVYAGLSYLLLRLRARNSAR
jgi:hypothetical protein